MFRNDSLFGRFMNVLGDVLFTGILWLIASLPVLTVGTASTAAYYAMSKCVRHKTGYLWKEFLHSLRVNLKQSLILSLIYLVVLLVLGLDIWYVWNNDSKLNSAVFVILIFVLFLAVSIGIYLWPLLSRFEKKNSELIKTAFIVSFRYLPLTLGLVFLLAVSIIGVYLMPWAVLAIPGVYIYIISFPVEWILKKMMPVPEEGSIEAEKWYYQ
ncbi:MAG: YesL family protein [Lachnospiraceae bacterium]|nr:YesL family protein [Lachnospiraceae bacterium]